MKEQDNKLQNKTTATVVESTSIQHRGPIPHPDILAGYAKINPSFPERILCMAEDNNRASIENDKDIVRKTFFSRNLGQYSLFFWV